MNRAFSKNVTALLFFTRSAEDEARAKQLIENGSYAENRSLARFMITETERLLRKTGYPVRVITSDQQRGDTFGERFANAFSQLFDEGFERVLSVGNDCLEMDLGLLKKALHSLDETELVIGPAADGGAYMIGMHRDIFDHSSFERLRWETGNLLEDLVGFARRQSVTIKLFEKLSDIDHQGDLIRLLHYVRYKLQHFRWAAVLCGILNSVSQHLSPRSFIPACSPHLSVPFSLRAPPSVS